MGHNKEKYSSVIKGGAENDGVSGNVSYLIQFGLTRSLLKCLNKLVKHASTKHHFDFDNTTFHLIGKMLE